MVYDDTAKKLAIKAIGTVESNLNYQAVNYNDPITVGFMQWYGTRAAGILQRIRTDNPSSWTGVEASLTTALDSHDANEGTYWPNKYLTRAEGESLKPVLNNNKAIQNAQAIEDLDAYVIAAESAGMDKDANTEAMLFFFVMYHQSPKRGLGVVASAGPDSSIDRLYSVCMNEPVLSNYRTRYTTARDIIKSGNVDGIDDIPDDEIDTSDPGGDNGSDVERLKGDIKYVHQRGDLLYIRLASGHDLPVYPNGRGWWILHQDAQTGADVPDTPIPPPVDPPADVTDAQAKLVAFMTSRIDRYAYSQGASRLNPEANMYTDCSGLVYFAYKEVIGINIGTYTGNQYNQGDLVTQGNGPGANIDQSLLQPGDLIFWNWSGGRNVDHVEMFIGNDQICGHGGPDPGPDIQTLSEYGSRSLNWVVRRHLK